VHWYLIAGIATGFALLAARSVVRRRSQDATADAAGLVPVRDLTHIPEALQRSALWLLADGGFERRVVHGVVSRGVEDVDVTAFDMETLRERRGEWAFLPVEPPFRIGGVVSVVVCEVDRCFPHVLFKHVGAGDLMLDDDLFDRAGNIAKAARDGFGLSRSYPAELPKHLAPQPIDIALPEHWRVYGASAGLVAELLAGFRATLERTDRRDLVVELIDGLVIVYPAAHDIADADAFADLTQTALALTDGLLASTPRLSPRGVEAVTSP
jgi:hypothetical protein